MSRIVLSILLVCAIIYFVPFLVYSLGSVVAGLQPPEGSPAGFLLGVLVSKLGTAVVFVLIFYLARDAFQGRWLLYACLWWLMFVVGEIGQAIGPGYGWKDAITGMISETIYCPLAAWAMQGLLSKT